VYATICMMLEEDLSVEFGCLKLSLYHPRKPCGRLCGPTDPTLFSRDCSTDGETYEVGRGGPYGQLDLKPFSWRA
jgi:hypothetical protein